MRCLVFVLVVTLCGTMALFGCAGESNAPNDDGAAREESGAVEPGSGEEAAGEKPAEDGEAAEDAEAEEPEEAGDPELAARLQGDIQAIADASGLQVGAYVVDLTTGTRAECAGSTQFVSASMIKLIIAEAFLNACDEGSFALDDTYVLRAEDIVGGTGYLAGRGVGASVTYRELVHAMISASDNTATNVLIDAIGMDAVNARAKALGLVCTQLNRKMMDLEAQAAGTENYTCAADIAALLELVYNDEFVSKEASAVMREALEAQTDVDGIRAGLPADVVFAHKTGTLATVRHDGGIVEGERPFVIVVLCGGDGFYEGKANDVMAQVASTVYADLA